MPLPLLVLIMLACMPESWPKPFWLNGELIWQPIQPILFTWAGILLLVASAGRISRRTCRDLYRYPDRRESILRRYSSRRTLQGRAVYVFYLAALYGLGWGWAVQNLIPDVPGLSEVVILTPFLTALVLSWAYYYNAERTAQGTAAPELVLLPFCTRKQYLIYHIRQKLGLVLVPLVLLILIKSLSRFADENDAWIIEFVSLAILAGVFTCLPWILRLILGVSPLPDGPLRQRLLATSRRLNFRCTNILLWNTHGGMANAVVVGFLPFLRYVLLSDRLVSDLTTEEVEAVFGHEIGHVKHHHMPYYLGFLFASLMIGATLVGPLPSGAEDWKALPFIVGVMGTYVFIVFGFLSRRCERQADIFGCRAVSCSRKDCNGHAQNEMLSPAGAGLCPTGIKTFISALEKVVELNGISRSRPGWMQSWQHSTPARRVEFLQRMLADPRLEPRFQRAVALVKWGLVICLGLLLVYALESEAKRPVPTRYHQVDISQ